MTMVVVVVGTYQVEDHLEAIQSNGDIAKAEHEYENAQREGDGQGELHLGTGDVAAATGVEDAVRAEQ